MWFIIIIIIVVILLCIFLIINLFIVSFFENKKCLVHLEKEWKTTLLPPSTHVLYGRLKYLQNCKQVTLISVKFHYWVKSELLHPSNVALPLLTWHSPGLLPWGYTTSTTPVSVRDLSSSIITYCTFYQMSENENLPLTKVSTQGLLLTGDAAPLWWFYLTCI